MSPFIDRRGQLFDYDSDGSGSFTRRVIVLESIPPPNDGPGALRFVNHRCLMSSNVRGEGSGFYDAEFYLVEDLENDWESGRTLKGAYEFRRLV